MEESSFFKQFEIPELKADHTGKTLGNSIDFKAIMNLVFINGQKMYTYEGSLTTPPCSEIVSWHVFKNPLKISHETYEKLKEFWYEESSTHLPDGNWRKPLALNGRTVTYSKFCSASSVLLKFSLLIVSFALLMF